MKKCIVITTINGTEGTALSAFADTGLEVLIAGDTRTPESFDVPVSLLSIDEQKEKYPKLADVIPVRHYSRKNFGYLEAMKKGYDVIIESDDDNYPEEDWFTTPEVGTQVLSGPRFPNVYSHFSNRVIWPRGFPLSRIHAKDEWVFKDAKQNVMVWQGLVDEDPDVDAVYRLVLGAEGPVKFDRNKLLVLDRGVVSAFNSQNTYWSKSAFYLLYLPVTVSFRYTDILRSFVAQYGIWAQGGHIGFISPNAKQFRNEHDLMKDFKDEYSMQVSFNKVIETLDSCVLQGQPGDLLVMYEALHRAEIVLEGELAAVRAWLNEYEKILA